MRYNVIFETESQNYLEALQRYFRFASKLQTVQFAIKALGFIMETKKAGGQVIIVSKEGIEKTLNIYEEKL